MSNWVRVCCKK